MLHFSDDQINQARAFLTSFLESNNYQLSAATAIQALAAYKGLLVDSTEAAPVVPVEDTDEYKALQEELNIKTEEHALDVKQRDYNWSELQKATTLVKELEAKLEAATATTEDAPISGSAV